MVVWVILPAADDEKQWFHHHLNHGVCEIKCHQVQNYEGWNHEEQNQLVPLALTVSMHFFQVVYKRHVANQEGAQNVIDRKRGPCQMPLLQESVKKDDVK